MLEKSQYSIGDTLRGNCTSPPSVPSANITWYINDKQVRIILKFPRPYFGNFGRPDSSPSHYFPAISEPRQGVPNRLIRQIIRLKRRSLITIMPPFSSKKLDKNSPQKLIPSKFTTQSLRLDGIVFLCFFLFLAPEKARNRDRRGEKKRRKLSASNAAINSSIRKHTLSGI